jgi:hypothetical protein
MKQTTKKTLAREIVILFSCSILIGLAWTIFWTVNKFHRSNVEQLQIEIYNLTNDIDSIQTTFPKIKSFQDLISGKVPVEYLIEERFIPTPEEVLGTEQEKERATNIRQLYKFLKASKYPFSDNSYISDFHCFKDEIDKELNFVPFDDLPDSLKRNANQKEIDNIASQPLLKKIYSFLKSENYSTVKFLDLTFYLYAVPLPPKFISWKIYQDDIKKRDTLKSELNTSSAKIYSANDLKDIAKWIAIIVLTLVYPFRFLYLLLKWAIKTLRQNAT